MRIKGLPFWMFEILAGPAHVWIYICAKLCGVTVEHAWKDDPDDSPTQDGE